MSCYFQKNCIISLKIVFVFANNVDPGEIPYLMQHFIWGFTICQSTHLGFTSVQKVNIMIIINVLPPSLLITFANILDPD